ncbi:MAG: hypothetical protein LBJ74_03960 [Heliobacteriaceae bacterium]|jgi:hypothetical protein|nr:hypothetical protein [Heliobacteriaceae bacterium]
MKVKYQKWIDKICSEMLDLSHSARVWDEIMTIQNKSKHFKTCGRPFQHWMMQNYSYRMIIQLSRLVEPEYINGDGLSFHKFLTEIRDKNYISFKRYTKEETLPTEEDNLKILRENISSDEAISLPYTIEDAIRSFESITSQKYTDTCFCCLINKDLEKLNMIRDKLKRFRNKAIAHLTDAEIKNIPTFKDLDDNLKILRKIANKYSVLLNHSHQVFEYVDLNLNRIFKKAWID